MVKVILFAKVFFVCLSVQSQQIPNSTTIEEVLIKYIKDDMSERLGIKSDSFYFQIANVKVRLRLRDMRERIIVRNYDKQYSYGNTELNQKYRQLVFRIDDSLAAKEINLNRICSLGTQPALKINRDTTVVYIFLSNFCDNKIYAEVINGYSIITYNGGYDIYGRAYCYLFEIENDRILYVYNGEIDYN